jgi:large subunit ribosomal protein L21
MYAIVETGGKQFPVSTGDIIRVETLAGEAGSEIELPVKAAFNEGGEMVSGATVKGTIVGAGRGPKIIVFKFKRKKQYKKTIGHRQNFTEVKIGDILTAGGQGHVEQAHVEQAHVEQAHVEQAHVEDTAADNAPAGEL